MKHRPLALRPDTYEKIKEHRPVRVLNKPWRRFANLSPRDKIVVHVTPKRAFAGVHHPSSKS